MQIAILGRQPKISLAELESLFGAENITAISDYAALIDTDQPLPQPWLGGIIKSAKLLTKLEKTDLGGAFKYLADSIPEHLQSLPEGKLQLGVSCCGFDVKSGWILKKMLGLKKVIKNNGHSVRIIENKKPELEAAQVLYNKLTGPLGWELLLIKAGNDVLLAQTYAVQDIDSYAKRDFERPKRDAYVGMLPPKLAQTMINLAVGKMQTADGSLRNQDPDSKICVLDPFCGTGVVLQEAALMGFDIYGTDISEKMVEYTKTNLAWLAASFPLRREPSQKNRASGTQNKLDPLIRSEDDKLRREVEQADATTHQWDFSKIQDLNSKIYVVCETYLGKPLTRLPQQSDLAKIASEANAIAEGFLKNISSQLKQGTRLCVALPAWHLGNNEFLHLKVLDHITDLGYNRLDLVHAKQSELIYHRPDQIVARELTILVKK